MPGKRDCTVVDKCKEQTRILNDYLSNTFIRFQATHPAVKISFSSFCKLRPRHVRLTKFLSRNSCLCAKHQNMALKLKVLKAAKVITDVNPEHISEDAITETLEKLSDDNYVYDEWKRVEGVDGRKRMKIVTVEVTREEFKTLLMKEVKEFAEHVARVRAQFEANQQLKKSLLLGECVVQMDFAQNYVCQNMDEIQSAYWTNASVTLHPVVIWWKDDQHPSQLKTKSYVFVSDVNHHNTAAVFTILSKLIPKIKQTVNGLKKIHYWTDSPTSQYRHKSIFHVVANHNNLSDGITCTWNYFESGHGKGPCDGIGGCAKRMASEAVKQQKVQIQDASPFFCGHSKLSRKLSTFYTQNKTMKRVLIL